MARTNPIVASAAGLVLALASELLAQQPPVATFKSGVDVVRVAAVVRDHKGRFVRDLSARDFEILDGGWPRTITDFHPDTTGVSVALLFDVSGSMEGHLASAREAATHLLSWRHWRPRLSSCRVSSRAVRLRPRRFPAAPTQTGRCGRRHPCGRCSPTETKRPVRRWARHSVRCV